MQSLEIAVGLDGSTASESALKMAITLAHASGANATLIGVHVVAVTHLSGRLLKDLAGLLGFQPVIVPADVERFYTEQGREVLESFRARCESEGVACRIVLEVGNPVERLIHQSGHADVLVLGARGSTDEAVPGWGGWTLERVVRDARCTTVVVPHDLGAITGIVLGWNASHGAAMALRSTRHFVELLPVPVHAVHVQEGRVSSTVFDEVHAQLDPLVELHTHLVVGEAQEALVAAADENDCNLIALGYRARSFLAGAFLGRVTDWLLRRVTLGLLVAR